MSRYTAVSDVDYYEELNPGRRTSEPFSDTTLNPQWWRDEFKRLATLKQVLDAQQTDRATETAESTEHAHGSRESGQSDGT